MGYFEPRDRATASRTVIALCAVAVVLTLLFAVVTPSQGGSVGTSVSYFVPGMLGLLLLTATSRWRVLVWGLAPLVGIVLVSALDLATHDPSAAGQVFLCYPVLYSASQLRPVMAGVSAATALVGDAVVVFSLETSVKAWTDFAYVSSTLVAMSLLLAVSGIRQDRLVAELRRQAAADSLTGLVNRRVLDEAARCALAGREHAGTALVILDIDHFKSINDTHGHPTGDDALVRIGRLLSRHARPGDVVSRLGGDELAVLMPGCPLTVAARRAEEMVAAVAAEELTGADGRRIALSVSAGVAHCPQDAGDLHSLYVAADRGLYRAKSAGRGRVGTLSAAA